MHKKNNDLKNLMIILISLLVIFAFVLGVILIVNIGIKKHSSLIESNNKESEVYYTEDEELKKNNDRLEYLSNDYMFVVDIPDEYDLSLDYFPETDEFGGSKKFSNDPDYQYTYDDGRKAGEEMDQRTLELITQCYWYRDLKNSKTLSFIKDIEKACEYLDTIDSLKMNWKSASRPDKFATIHVYYCEANPDFQPYKVRIKAEEDSDYLIKDFDNLASIRENEYPEVLDVTEGFVSTFSIDSENCNTMTCYYDGVETGGVLSKHNGKLFVEIDWQTNANGSKEGALEIMSKILGK